NEKELKDLSVNVQETTTGSLLFPPTASKDSTRPTEQGGSQVKPQQAPSTKEQHSATRRIIRSGDVEFEIQSFDAALAAISKLVNEIRGGFVATVNSEKLPNGKVRGSVVVRVPPEALDSLLLDLRKELGKLGELKGMKIGSEDITKKYTDLESHLRAARA